MYPITYCPDKNSIPNISWFYVTILHIPTQIYSKNQGLINRNTNGVNGASS